MIAIYKKELRSYFNSMIGYVLVAVFMAVISLYFGMINMINGYTAFASALYATFVFLIVIIPVLTMRSFAEERKTKTDQLLLTYPVSVFQIVLGKFLALITVFAIPLLISCIFPLIIAANGQGSLGVDYATIFCYFLVGCLFISIGIFVSSHTENQIISAIITAIVLFLVYNIGSFVDMLPSESRYNMAILIVIIFLIAIWLYFNTKNYLVAMAFACVCVVASCITYRITIQPFASLISRTLAIFNIEAILTNFAGYRVFDVGGVVLLITLTALFLFLTTQSVQKRRWN